MYRQMFLKIRNLQIQLSCDSLMVHFSDVMKACLA